jgi:hypothetical protein
MNGYIQASTSPEVATPWHPSLLPQQLRHMAGRNKGWANRRFDCFLKK